MSVFWIPVLGTIGAFTWAIVAVVNTSRTKQRKAQLAAEVQMKMIDRFGTADDFVKFIQSPEGKQFLGDAPRVARVNYIGGIRTGVISGFIGLGFVFIAMVQDDSGWFIPGFIMLGIGAGFFVSSWLSMKLAREMESGDSK